MTLQEIVDMAEAEGWRINPPTLEKKPIALDGETVGFYCPHPVGRGRTRVGPIYVVPQHRGKGLGLQAYEWADGVKLVAYVHNGNMGSERLHEKARFVRWYKAPGGYYWKRD